MFRTAAIATLLLALTTVPVAPADDPAGVEVLRGGSFEGPEGYVVSGWERQFRGGSEVAPGIARTGLQSVNLGKTYPAHTTLALGKVSAIPATLLYAGPEIYNLVPDRPNGLPEAATSGAPFAELDGFSLWTLAPSPLAENQFRLQTYFEIRTQVFEHATPPLQDEPDVSHCVVQADLWEVETAAEWRHHAQGRDDLFWLLNARCNGTSPGYPAPVPLATLQADPALADARVISVTVQSIVPQGPWLGPSVYVDDLSMVVQPRA